ncbi:uncharacterized protein TM35_000471070, partial [Trypanosoma theileri]
TCGAGSRVSACGKYADLCRQRTARTATTTTTTITTAAGELKAVMAYVGSRDFNYYEWWNNTKEKLKKECRENADHEVEGINCTKWLQSPHQEQVTNLRQGSGDHAMGENAVIGDGVQGVDINQPVGAHRPGSVEMPRTVIAEEGQQQEGGTLGEVKASGSPKQKVESKDLVSAPEAAQRNEVIPSTKRQGEDSNVAIHGNQGTPNNTSVNTVTGEDQPTQQSPLAVNATAAPDSKESTNNNESTDSSASGSDMGVTAKTETEETNSTTPPSTENTTTEAPTTTPSPVPVTDPQISTITSAVQKNKANVDSSVSPVWMRTAAPLLIVLVLFSATVY